LLLLLLLLAPFPGCCSCGRLLFLLVCLLLLLPIQQLPLVFCQVVCLHVSVLIVNAVLLGAGVVALQEREEETQATAHQQHVKGWPDLPAEEPSSHELS
jgi:hypothetical protein